MIARTIIGQLGNVCLSMLGAHTLVDLKDGLLFQIQGSETVDAVQIILHPSDTYIMTFWKIQKETRKLTAEIPFTTVRWEVVKTIDDVYWDMLHDLIEEETGLYVSLTERSS
jgi:hypothetical protein